MNFPSRLLENAVNEMSGLPGIGKKTALRLVLHLLRQSEKDVKKFTNALTALRKDISYCETCFNISDQGLCSVCANPSRDESTICVVEEFTDIISVENTNQFRGHYHVLGGIISPMDGIGPNDLKIDELVRKVESGKINEVILALSTTMEGDTTNFYLFKRLHSTNVKITTIARGVAIGDEIEYTDEVTLGRSIVNRTPYTNSVSH